VVLLRLARIPSCVPGTWPDRVCQPERSMQSWRYRFVISKVFEMVLTSVCLVVRMAQGPHGGMNPIDRTTMRRRHLTLCAVVAASVLTAISTPALASTAKPVAAQSAQISPDVFTGYGYIKYFNEYLTYPGYPVYENGAEISFHDYGEQSPNNSSVWNADHIGTVSKTGPFRDPALDSELYGHAVIKLRHYLTTDWDLGASDDSVLAVLRPDTSGNYLVEYSLGGPDYELIDVYASNEFDGLWCVQNSGSDSQAALAPCTSTGTTLAWESSF
jgi:hypothetical protein